MNEFSQADPDPLLFATKVLNFQYVLNSSIYCMRVLVNFVRDFLKLIYMDCLKWRVHLVRVQPTKAVADGPAGQAKAGPEFAMFHSN